jgi:hypothetical protein
MSFRGAALILSKARGRHLGLGSLLSRTNLVNYLFEIWFILSTLPEEEGATSYDSHLRPNGFIHFLIMLAVKWLPLSESIFSTSPNQAIM